MMEMHEDPVLTNDIIGDKMDELRQKFTTFYMKPDPEKNKKDSKYGGYDDWLNDLKRTNYTQY